MSADERPGTTPGTEVTARDLASGESESVTICDDYIVITDGDCYLDGVQLYRNGTAVITVKKGKVPSV